MAELRSRRYPYVAVITAADTICSAHNGVLSRLPEASF